AYPAFILLPELAPKTLADSIEILLSDQEKYRKIQENCKLASAVWNWENEEKILLDFYKTVFEPPKTSKTI
ncbi:MAG: hypothetical protein AAF789_15065, partial [Bacteroidota bacterium]